MTAAVETLVLPLCIVQVKRALMRAAAHRSSRTQRKYCMQANAVVSCTCLYLLCVLMPAAVSAVAVPPVAALLAAAAVTDSERYN
jgi:hypothetical protein